MRKNNKNLKTISNVLDNFIKKKKWEKNFALERLKEDWIKVAGKNIALHTTPLYIKGKKLFIEVDSPIWSTQLNYLKNQIIETINNYYDMDIIKNIFFSIKK